MSRDYFDDLGVASTASMEEIRSAYRRLAKRFHPDRYGGGSAPFRRIQEAYAVLADPERRTAYEEGLKQRRRAARPYHPPESGAVRSSRFRSADSPRMQSPEPLVPETPIPPSRPFSATGGFSPAEKAPIQDFDPHHRRRPIQSAPEAGATVTLTVDLTRELTVRGGELRLTVPLKIRCPHCRGAGAGRFHACPRCGGRGILHQEIPLEFSIPPGLTAPQRVTVPLTGEAGESLRLSLLFRPWDRG